MALSETVKRSLRVSMATHAAGDAIATALDANTLKTSYSASAAVALNTAKTSMPTATTIGITSGTATTTWLKSQLGRLVTNLDAKGHVG